MEKLRFVMLQMHDGLITVLKDAEINWDFGTITGFSEATGGKSTALMSSMLLFSEISEEYYNAIAKRVKKNMALLVEGK